MKDNSVKAFGFHSKLSNCNDSAKTKTSSDFEYISLFFQPT